MKVVKHNLEKHKYKCRECGSIVEIRDDEFSTKKDFKPFPYLMGLKDFKTDTTIKRRVCDCPICGATIIKEYNLLKEVLL